MGSLTEKVGDLFEASTKAIGHGVNTKGAMASGIAVVFRDQNPAMHTAYLEVCERGSLQAGDVLAWPGQDHFILNMFTQVNPGADASLEHIESSLRKASQICHNVGVTSLGIPRIGSGVGGLDWDSEVRPLLDRIVPELPIDVEVYVLPDQI